MASTSEPNAGALICDSPIALVTRASRGLGFLIAHEEFSEIMDSTFWGTLNATLAALPMLHAAGSCRREYADPLDGRRVRRGQARPGRHCAGAPRSS
jgi:hypothetical protein